MEWLDESEKTLDSEVEIANDPGKIKMQLAQHKVNEHRLITVYREKNESRNNQGPFDSIDSRGSFINRNNVCIQTICFTGKLFEACLTKMCNTVESYLSKTNFFSLNSFNVLQTESCLMHHV